MVKKAISWALVGAFTFAWWWVGHRWPYLNTEGNQWAGVFDFFTLVSAVALVRGPRAAGAGMFGALIGTARNFLPTLLWLALAVVVFRAVAMVLTGVANPVDHFTHAVVTAVLAGLITALWYGAMANADGQS
jgi:hypothetical protein